MQHRNRHIKMVLGYSGALAMLLAVSVVVGGCNVGAKLRAKSTEINELNAEMEKRAYKCAPKELALAQAHTTFGQYELDQANWVRADEHLALAYKNANLADIHSRAPECQEVAVVVRADRDGDGILDDVDKCPENPEDFDGFEDEDGCPEDQDTDGDGIPDSKDLCPTEKGTVANQGCPQVVQDKDGDGIQDPVDKCPLDPEDFDGFQDEDGCPDLDNDNDGIPDVGDKCPNEPEDNDGFEDEDGCPDYDNDKDNILDLNDKCPNDPEDYDGDQDDDGCPDEYKLIVVKDDRIEIKQKIYFETAKAKIRPVSYPILNEVADVLTKRTKINIRIEGHTDSRGGDAYNKRLSQKRAESVRTYLIGQGLSPDRLTAVGYGEERPIEDNATEDGRERNRRVEFHITAH